MTMIRPLLLLALLFPWPALVATAQPFEVAPTPNPSPDWNVFRSAGGTSDTDVWAVGERRDGPLHHILYHWDGTGWSETPAPQVFDNRDHMLFGVSAVAPDAAWAGGLYSGAGSLASGYVLRWDGDDWALAFNQPGWPVLDVWALAEDDVWAVGTTNDVRPTPALALHWNGSGWTRIDPPIIGNRDHELEAVHASAPDNVWAVGRYNNVGGGRFPYVVRWEGNSWEEVQMPFFFSTTLLDVVTFGPDDTWVAVDLGNVWHWDGSSWTEHAVLLGAFAAVASDDIYGFRGNSVYHWDGASWDLVQTLPGLSNPSFRSGAVALPDGAVLAVGRTVEAGGEYRTLAIRKTGATTPVEPGAEPAAGFRLSAGYPNPFELEATFTLVVAQRQHVAVEVLDALGRRVAVLHDGVLAAGASHSFTLDGADLSSGLYVVRATGESFTTSRMATLLK